MSLKKLDKYCLPIIIPSFSSKGNLIIKSNNGEVSDNYNLLSALKLYLFNVYLVSSYDIYYKLMPSNADQYPLADYIFIDSGGYEISDSYDFCEKYKFNYMIREWDKQKMLEVYEKMYSSPILDTSKLILCSYDNYGSIKEQAEEALILKEQFPNAIIDFLIKVPNDVDLFCSDLYEQILKFNILGFTEKEIGGTLKEKLLNIIKIRETLDSFNWEGAIHIFGGLEPNILVLYYWAGANIFDGLSWQKIRYIENSTLHNPKYYMIDKMEIENKLLMIIDNISLLNELEYKLKNCTKNNDLNVVRSKFKEIILNDNLNIEQIVLKMGGI